MIKAVIFDMDGLLIDSEPFWRQAEVEILRPLGVPITEADCTQTMGQRIDMAVTYWHHRHPWQTPSIPIVADQIVNRVNELIIEKGQPLPGVMDCLKMLQSLHIPMAIASSSSSDLIASVVDTFDIRSFFSALCSAENEQYGKPHPAVYLNAAKALKIDPQFCLVFEDSVSGLIAAKAAQMQTVAIPEAGVPLDPRFAIADITLRSMTEFDKTFLTALGSK